MIAIRSRSSLVVCSMFLLVSSARLSVAWAQDGADKEKPAEKPAVPQPPAAPDADRPPTADPRTLLARMQELYAHALREPAPLDRNAADLAEARRRRNEAQTKWEHAVRQLAKAGDDYLVAIADAAPAPEALYYRGVGKVILATRQSAAETQATYEAAADSLSRYLQATDDKAAFRADAQMYLGRALVFLAAWEPRRLDEALPHLRSAILLLQRDGRRDEAGRTAAFALDSLAGRAGMREFAEAIQAGSADFGASTPTVRRHAAAASTAVGSAFPRVDGPRDDQGRPSPLRDVDGNPLSLQPDGKPLLVHFFLTGFSNGEATNFRDVQTDIRPLWQQYREKGLRVVGVCMDWAMPKEKADERRRQWDEWGHKKPFRDGSLESCRDWARTQGVEWPWYWDGLWTKNPISLALGGVGVSEPHVVLVDGAGSIRWRGSPTPQSLGKRDPSAPSQPAYPGLADEVAKLLR